MRQLISSVFVGILLFTACYVSPTVHPEDVIVVNPLIPEGEVTTFTATVSDLTVSNPFITITFNTPVNEVSVIFDTTIIVEYPIGTPLIEGTGYNAVPLTEASSSVILDFGSAGLLAGDTVRVILDPGINASVNILLLLSNPGNFDKVVLP